MRPLQHRRGFTIILAIVLLGLVAVAAGMIVHQLGYELLRTRTAYEDAQLRQLLLAGAKQVASNGDRYGEPANAGAQKLDLPKVLIDESASVSISSVTSGPQTGDLLIQARFGAREASETLRRDQTSHQWRVEEPSE